MGPETIVMVVLLLTVVNALLALVGAAILYLVVKVYTEYIKDRAMDRRAEGGKKPGLEGLLQMMASQAGRRPRTAPVGAPVAEHPSPADEPGGGLKCKATAVPGGGEGVPGEK